MKAKLKNYIRQFVTLSEKEFNDIESLFVKKNIARKTIILHEGEVCNFEAFILKGCLKSYFIDKNGHELVLTFAIENWWISDISSFNDQTPSHMFIETIEDSEILILTHNAKEVLLKKNPKLEKMFRIMVQRHLKTYQDRLFANIAYTAEVQYDMFLKKYASVAQRVPQHLIASFLGISPEFLSRLRQKKSKLHT